MLASAYFKNYIYFRLAPPGTKPTVWSQVFTNLFSAFWHGFYPGFYIGFIYLAYNVDLARQLRAKLRPMFMRVDKDGKEVGNYPTKYFYDFAGWYSSTSHSRFNFH